MMNKVYYSKRRPLLTLYGTTLIICSISIWALAHDKSFFVTGLLLSIVGLSYIIPGQFLILIISPTQIVFKNSVFYTIRSDWDNVEKLVLIKNDRYIKLNNPIQLSAWAALGWLISQELRERLIPFDEWENLAALQKDMMLYAPHLNLLQFESIDAKD